MNRLRFSGVIRKKRRLALSVFGVFLFLSGITFVVSGYYGSAVRTASAEGSFVSCEDAPEEAGICEDEAEIYIWRDYVIPENAEFRTGKTLYIEEGATLSVRPGARIVFAGSEDGSDDSETPARLFLFGGKIEMIGTAERPVVVEREENGPGFSIELKEGEAEFDHVRIRGGGLPQVEDVRPAFLKPLFPIAAYADDYYWSLTPAMEVGSATVSVRNSAFVDSEGADIHMAQNVRGQYIDWNGDLRWEYTGALLVENSDFDGDVDVPAFLGNFATCGQSDCQKVVTLRNDWYGDASGPRTFEYYADRAGKEVLGAVTMDSFSTTSFFAVCEECASNVLFLPGIKASRLYMREDDGGEDQLWPPNDFIGNDVEDLHFDGDGKSEHDVYTRDVISEILPPIGGNIYKSFLADLQRMKTEGTINDYVPFAYDWRQSVMDIVENGTPYEDGIRSPIDELIQLAESSKSGQVTIVAHSNGGLLAKALMVRLEEMGREDLVDRMILVASPQMGTPVSILTLLYGYEESIVKGYILRLLEQWEARELVETIPGAFGLLPSAEYFDRSEDDIVSFASGDRSVRLPKYRDAYGSVIEDWDELVSFLSGEGDERDEPDAKDIDIENVLDTDLLAKADVLHEALDAWIPPENVELIEIAGWGLDTVSGIRYEEKEKIYCHPYIDIYCIGTGEFETFYEPIFTVDGDEIVTAPSAHMLPESDNVKRYWVDLSNEKGKKHKNIFELNNVREYLSRLIEKEDFSNIPVGISNERPSSGSYHIRMSLYSPLDVHITDDYENHVGPREVETENGAVTVIDENIPGSTYFQFGERKYVSFPAGEPIDIRLDGYADGAYTLKFEEIHITEAGEEIVSHTTFEYLPTTADTTVTLSIPESGLIDLSSLTADINGDDSIDYTIEPVPNGIATLEQGENDTMPPTTNIEVSGSEGENGWYVDSVSVILSADDGPGGSVVAATEYSLDESESWETYAEPFEISEEGVTNIHYRSTDEAGNIEETQQIEIKIDRASPTARIGFDPEILRITVSGSDDQSDVTITREENGIAPVWNFWRRFFSRNVSTQFRIHTIITDEAGHTTDITFTEERKYGILFKLSDFLISKDEITFDTSYIHASYHALPGRWGRDLALLSSFLRTDREMVLARYLGRRDKTWIVLLLDGRVTLKEWKNGIVVPMFEAEDNGIKIMWN